MFMSLRFYKNPKQGYISSCLKLIISMEVKITSISPNLVSRTNSGANNTLDNIWKGLDQIKLIQQALRIICKE